MNGNSLSGEEKPLVCVARAEYDQSLQFAVEEILDHFPRDWSGKRVLLKPNILAAHIPEKAATTHPLLVFYVQQALQRRGAEVVAGDNPGVGGYGRSEKAAYKTGIKEAAGEGYVRLFKDPVQLQTDSDHFSSLSVSREILEVDEVVNLPKLKTHCLTVLTAAVKNTFGYVVGADKLRIHANCPTREKFAEALLDVYKLRPPGLNIMDAVQAMEGNGPSNGKKVHLGRILAAENAVTLDCAAVYMLGRRIRDIPHLEQAVSKGLGTADPTVMYLQGELPRTRRFRFPQTFVPGISGVLMNRFFSRWANPLPRVERKKCSSCGLCTEHCPVGAMRMQQDRVPALEEDKCINCYCCQEMCPHDAIRFSGRFWRVLRR